MVATAVANADRLARPAILIVLGAESVALPATVSAMVNTEVELDAKVLVVTVTLTVVGLTAARRYILNSANLTEPVDAPVP